MPSLPYAARLYNTVQMPLPNVRTHAILRSPSTFRQEVRHSFRHSEVVTLCASMDHRASPAQQMTEHSPLTVRLPSHAPGNAATASPVITRGAQEPAGKKHWLPASTSPVLTPPSGQWVSEDGCQRRSLLVLSFSLGVRFLSHSCSLQNLPGTR
jgi:hypothetical protein